MQCRRVLFSGHAVRQMFQRQIGARDVEAVVRDGEVIAAWFEGHDEHCLLLGFCRGRPLHVVVARREDGACVVVTVYEPDPARWGPQYKRRQPE